MNVMGIDPGLSMTGWGVINVFSRDSISLITYGCVKTKPHVELKERLKEIHQSLRAIISEHKPEVIAIEELFFSKEARTVAAVSQARGAILVAAAIENIAVFEYNPRRVKIALTGYGSADKNQIQHMVKTFLRLQEIPKPDDAADALAMAICHAHTFNSLKM